jgi:hypothetical protein
MAVIHRTTLVPSKLELLAQWLPRQPWYQEASGAELDRAGGFRLDDPDGEVGIEFMVVRADAAFYLIPLTYRGAPLDGAPDALIGTSEHGVLGPRWIYDGVGDPVLIAQFAALLDGTAQPQAQSETDTPDPSVHCRCGSGEVTLHRVLEATEDADKLIELGGVTATWRLPSGEQVRGVVAS